MTLRELVKQYKPPLYIQMTNARSSGPHRILFVSAISAMLERGNDGYEFCVSLDSLHWEKVPKKKPRLLGWRLTEDYETARVSYSAGTPRLEFAGITPYPQAANWERAPWLDEPESTQ